MKTYFYTTEEIANEAASCGLKLSHVANGTASVYGKEMPCIVTYLHPADCPGDCRGTAVLKLTLEDGKAFVGEGLFAGSRFDQTLIPAKDYRVGTYRNPRCVLICSVFPEQIERYDSAMDEPLFYESSESLYRDTVMSKVQESDTFRELALRSFYNQEAELGHCDRVEEDDAVVYVSKEDGKIVFCFPTHKN